MPHPFLTDEQIEEWKTIQGNCSFTPTYVDLFRGMWRVISWYYKPSMWKDYRFPQAFIDDFTRHFIFPAHQIFYIICIALFITFLRFIFEKYFCQVC